MFPIAVPYRSSLENQKLVEDIRRQQIENMFAPNTLYQELIKSRLANQYYAPKTQAEIDLIKQGQIPHYQAMNNLIKKGQIPHFLMQNALIREGQIPHLRAQSGLLNEQKEEQGLKNQFTKEQLRQWKDLQDEIDRLQGQNNNPNQQYSGGYSYPSNMPNLKEEQQKRINNSINNSNLAFQGAIEPQQIPKLQQAMYSQQQTPQPQQENNTNRLASLREKQQSLFGNVGKLGVETPFSKEARAEQLAEKREDIKIYSQTLKDANKSAKDAAQMKGYIDQFQSAYSKLENKGAVLGRLPAFTSEQQIADNAAQNMQQVMIKLMNTNRMTNYELKFAGNLKLNRSMNPQTVKDVGDFLKAKAERLGEESKFINAAKNKGIGAEDAKVLWNEYENDRPVYNFEERKINKENLNSYGDYLTPEALNRVNNPKIQPNMQQTEMIRIVLPNGQEGNIPRNRLEEALKRGARVSQ